MEMASSVRTLDNAKENKSRMDSHENRLDENGLTIHPDHLKRNIKLLAKFISQLVESQRDFSEQLGLSYSRVFTDDYEDFKGKKVVDVIHGWLNSGSKEQVKLVRLLADISKHQMALIAASDGVVEYTVDKLNGQSSSLFNSKFKNYCKEIKENPHKRFNELVAPSLSSAYIKQREIQKSIK
jgi:hypothetical protein